MTVSQCLCRDWLGGPLWATPFALGLVIGAACGYWLYYRLSDDK